jgi:hypothetical protein
MNTETWLESADNRLLVPKECYATDSQTAALNVLTDNRRSHQLAYAHFIYSEFGDNPALESKPTAPPQQLMIYFSMAVVTVVGAGLRPLDKALQRNELQFVQRGTFCPKQSGRPSNKPTTIVTSVTISFTKETP